MLTLYFSYNTYQLYGFIMYSTVQISCYASGVLLFSMLQELFHFFLETILLLIKGSTQFNSRLGIP
jgi:hypothetical protein